MNESACAEDEAPPLVLAPPPHVGIAAGGAGGGAAGAPPPDILHCISACAQQTRLSLANLLPSRFVTGTRRPHVQIYYSDFFIIQQVYCTLQLYNKKGNGCL